MSLPLSGAQRSSFLKRCAVLRTTHRQHDDLARRAVRVLIPSPGTWGDVAPYLGLGRRLKAAGHEVTLACHARFEDAVRAHRLGCRTLPLDPMDFKSSDIGPTPPRSVIREHRRSHFPQIARGILDASRGGVDVLLTGLVTHPICAFVAEGVGARCLGTYLQPMRSVVRFGLNGVVPGRFRDRFVEAAVAQSAGLNLGPSLNVLQQDLGLPRQATRRALRALRTETVCHGYSPVMVPPLASSSARARTCGYWWPPRPDGWRPDRRLVDFLDSGSKPVFIGFGSMALGDAEQLGGLLVQALKKARLRAVVQSGWLGIHVAGDDVLTVSEVPHDWLFPRMVAVVHHAGAGTTGAGLKAGVPAVPVPIRFDQFYWASRLAALEVAPAPIPRRRLTADRLADALRDVVDGPVFTQRARAIASHLATEDGAAPVLAELEQMDSCTAPAA
ncbi:glycosyltransferase [Streptomyces sp. NPDC048595]|uniref:glycosyltransferase n=1 Tax=Streptomyces sp. NPDC048595 TaxID=3365576 RepID=UPI00371D23A6